MKRVDCFMLFSYLWRATNKNLTYNNMPNYLSYMLRACFTWLLLTLSSLPVSAVSRFFNSDQLSSNLITSMCQDKQGYIWVGTEYGLNRFDGVRFAQYYADDLTPCPIADNNVRHLMVDHDGKLWVQFVSGIQRYDDLTGNFCSVNFKDAAELTLSDITQCGDGTVLVLSAEKGIWTIDPKTMTATLAKNLNKGTPLPEAHTIMEDGKQRLWIATNDNGLRMIDTYTGRFCHFGEDLLGSRGVSGIGQDGRGRIVILSRTRLLVYNEKSRTLDVVMEVDRNLSARRMFASPQGDLYIGTFGHGLLRVDIDKPGLTVVEEHTPAVPLPPSTYSGLPDLSKQKVNAMLVDALQNIWIGCFQQGLALLSPRQYPFVFQRMSDYSFDNGGHLTALFGDHRGNVYVCQERNGIRRAGWAGRLEGTWLEGNTVIAGAADSQDYLWVGTYNNGACRLNLATGSAYWLPSLKGERIKAFAFDKAGNVYMSVFNKGLRSFIADGSDERVLCGGKLQLHNPYINQLMTDREGMIWIGHYYGLDIYDPAYDRLVEVPQDSVLRRATIFALAESSDGTVWVGSNHGLFCYDRNTKSWQHYDKSDGLPNEIICGIVETQDGNIWLSTYRGMSQLNRRTKTFTNYLKGNGLVESSYARGIFFTSPLGHVNFGTDDGITYFFAKDVKPVEFLRAPALTGLVVNGQQEVASDGKIVLPYTDNTFTLYFSTMDFRVPDNVVYEYRFSDDPDDAWHATAPGQCSINFTHLTSGNHRLEVRAVDNGVRSPIAKIQIRITPPWYRSWIAYTLYILGLLVLAFLIWRNWRNKQLAEVNESKIRFFVDISHELRSPLTLIKSPVDALLKGNYDKQTTHALRNIQRNTDRLLLLVNQILSIRKIEKGQQQVHFAKTDMAKFVSEICRNYDYQAEKRNISLTFSSDAETVNAWIDREQFDKVVNNLIGNAMKYVDEGGHIEVELAQTDGITLTVRDDGPGIDEAQLKKVFQRFFQLGDRPATGQMGYGIGLNLTQKIVALHGGTIQARNRSDQSGSEFIVMLPAGNGHLQQSQLVDETYFDGMTSSADTDVNTVEQRSSTVRRKTNYRIVVVDDDEEIRQYLTTELSETYHVTPCVNGQEALQIVTTEQPSLVITDVMMPVMDGFTLLHRLKNNTATSHIPVLMLTTRTEHQAHIEGLEKGADAYMDKPFNMEELEARVAGLIANRNRLRGKFSGVQSQTDVVKNIELKGNNEQLMERIMKTVNERLSDEDFNVEALADAVGLSRVQLHRRVKEMTGISVGEFIRNLRLQQAARLLEKGDITVSQVTYAIGMVNPTHFSSAFKRYFGVTPTEYMNKHQQETNTDA